MTGTCRGCGFRNVLLDEDGICHDCSFAMSLDEEMTVDDLRWVMPGPDDVR